MHATWLTAAQAIDRARQLVVIGYSLPGTDGATIELLKFFFRQAAKRREILVVDPSPAVIERYRMILDVDVSHVGVDFAAFDPTTL
jgi:hypothetical protein